MEAASRAATQLEGKAGFAVLEPEDHETGFARVVGSTKKRAQLAVDTTLVSAFKGDGEPKRGAADRDGVAFAAARRDKERTYRELVTWCTRTIGGSCSGSGRQVVRGSQDLCAVVGKGSGQIRTTTHATSC